MLISDKYENLPNIKRVVVLGNFDGVHLGHTKLINTSAQLARQLGIKNCVYTFQRHRHLDTPGFCGLITDNPEKTEVISHMDVDTLFFDNFNSIKNLSCEEFCKKILVEKLGCEVAVCGKNYSFGKNRSGDSACLKYELEKLGKTAVICDHVVDANGDIVNSTAIRKCILEGDVEKAMEYLGRPFSIFYPVIHGRHLGTQIGIPTVNQHFCKEKIKPKNGVYACVCTVGDKKYCGVANVGTKPTVTHDETDPPVLCETHIIGYNGDLYGQQVKIEFYRRLRDEKKFSSLDELVFAVQENIKQTKLIFADREDIQK